MIVPPTVLIRNGIIYANNAASLPCLLYTSGMIPSLFKTLEDKPQKFILYLDDLSFEKHEPEYRSLKVAMEGQLGSMPQNVLIYATSNRRHLIKENWKDREGGDVHVNDNMQEMLSLSERFGIDVYKRQIFLCTHMQSRNFDFAYEKGSYF